MTMLPNVTHAHTLSLSSFYTSALSVLYSAFCVSPILHSLPPQGVTQTKTLSHQGAMLHIILADHLCLCMCTPRIKDEREIMNVFYDFQGTDMQRADIRGFILMWFILN